MANYIVSDTNLTAIANAIRTKGGTSAQLEFPDDFVDAIGDIPSGGGGHTDDEWLSKAVSGALTYTGSSFGIMLDGFSELTSFSAPNLTSLYNANYFFRNCTKLESVSLPALIKLYGANVFENTKLQYLVLPNFGHEYTANQSTFAGNCCKNMSLLEGIDCYAISQIRASAFPGCAKLDTLVIRHKAGAGEDAIASLGDTNAFDGTPFASNGAGGTLYVPQSQISEYEAATNWSTILGYANNQIKSIESTHTDPNAPIDLTLYYADGTTIA